MSLIPTISCISLPLLLQHVFKEEMLCTPNFCAALPSKRGRLRGAFANVFEIEWKKQPFPCRVSEKNGVTLYSYKKEKKKDGNKKAPQIPYGISNFVRMRTENYYYVDKTMYLPLIEDAASYIFMIRPRHFGKSLFLSMMKAYYDILQKDRFESYSADYGLVRIPPTSATVSR